MTHDDIAKQVGCKPKTLRRRFRDELDRGSVEAKEKVAQSLFQMATTGKNVAAAIFWMKARAGWREKSEVHHSGAPQYVVHTGVPRDGLSDEALERIASSGLDEDELDRASQRHATHRSYVVGEQRELSVDEWQAQYKPRAEDGRAG